VEDSHYSLFFFFTSLRASGVCVLGMFCLFSGYGTQASQTQSPQFSTRVCQRKRERKKRRKQKHKQEEAMRTGNEKRRMESFCSIEIQLAQAKSVIFRKGTSCIVETARLHGPRLGQSGILLCAGGARWEALAKRRPRRPRRPRRGQRQERQGRTAGCSGEEDISSCLCLCLLCVGVCGGGGKTKTESPKAWPCAPVCVTPTTKPVDERPLGREGRLDSNAQPPTTTHNHHYQ
jgi:hypothetical protein